MTFDKGMIRGIILGFVVEILILGIFMWAMVRPQGLSQSQVSPEYWDLKVKYSEEYGCSPENVRFYREGRFYYVKIYNEVFDITESADERVIDDEINRLS